MLDVIANKVDVVARTVLRAVAGELVAYFSVIVYVNAVALAADLAGAFVIKLGEFSGVEDFCGRGVLEVFLVAGKRRAIMFGVFGSWAVAGLARDAQLRDLCTKT